MAADLTLGNGTIIDSESVVLGGLRGFIQQDDTPEEVEAKFVQFKIADIRNYPPQAHDHGFTFWSGTQAQYDAIPTKDGTTISLITG